MLTYLRYALACACFAASVGCLAFWWFDDEVVSVDYHGASYRIGIETNFGFASAYFDRRSQLQQPAGWKYSSIHAWESPWFFGHIEKQGRFGRADDAIYFPLWYPILIFALAGVAALRFRRQFSIRAALITVSVVAALVGIPVAL